MKTQRPGHGHPKSPSPTHALPPGQPEALDEKITHLTEEVAKTANRFKVPILVAIVATIAIVATSGLVSSITRKQEGERSERIYLLFRAEPAVIRADGPALQTELEGTRIEPVFVARYARWLYEENQPGDRERALALVAAARARHPGSLILEMTGNELEQAETVDAGFELPPLPPPPAPPAPPANAETGESAGAAPIETLTPAPPAAAPAGESAPIPVPEGGAAPPAPPPAPGAGAR